MSVIKFTILFTIFLSFMLPFFLALFLREIPNDPQPSLENTQQISKEATLSQHFISSTDNLSAVGMSIKNPNLRNRKDLTFQLFLENELLREVKKNGTSIADGAFVVFKFQPISNSENKKFVFQLHAPESSNEESLEVFFTSQNPVWSKELYVDSKLHDLDISFVTYQKKMNILSLPAMVVDQWWKKIIADPVFAATYLFIITSMAIYLVIQKLKS